MSIRGSVLRVEMLKRIKRSNWPRKRAYAARFRGWRWCWRWWGTSTLQNEHTWLVFEGGDGGGVEKEKSPGCYQTPPLWAAWGKDCLVLRNEPFVFSDLGLVSKVYSERQFRAQHRGKRWRTHWVMLQTSSTVSCMRSRSRKRAVHFQRSWARFEGLFWVSISSPTSKETVENSLSYATPKQRGPKSWVLQANLHCVEYVNGVVIVVGGCHGRKHFCGDGHNSPSPSHQIIVDACCPPWTRWRCDRVQTPTMSLLMSKKFNENQCDFLVIPF